MSNQDPFFATTGHDIPAILAQLAKDLPTRPPITQFAYQNPLSQYQHLPFKDAIAALTALNGGEGYLSDVQYREAYAQGLITDADIEAALVEDPSLQAHEYLLNPKLAITKADVYRIAMLFELEPVLPSQLAWQIEELNTLEKFQPDIPRRVQQSLLGEGMSVTVEKKLIAGLWQTLLNKLDLEQTYLHPENVLDLSLDQAEALLAQHRASQKKVSLKKTTMHERMQEAAVKTFASELERLGKDISLRNLMIDLCGIDILDNVRPQMIRLCSSGLDEGLAAWQLPGRQADGLYKAWRRVAGLDINPFLHELPDWQAIIGELPDDAEAAIAFQLTHLEIPAPHWAGYLRCLAMEIPGWSGLINWRAQHTEYRPANDAKPTLADYLAIRLTLDRLWLNQMCRDTWQIEATLSSLKNYFRKNASEYMVRWHLFRGNLPEYLIQQAENMTLSVGKEQYNRSEWQNLADIIWTWQGSSMANSRPVHSIYDSAWQLFRLLQHLGLSAEDLQTSEKADLEQVLKILDDFTPAHRRHTWQVAYECHEREQLLQFIQAQPQKQRQSQVNSTTQFIFSLDTCGANIRSVLEAQHDGFETFGVMDFAISDCAEIKPAVLTSLPITLRRLVNKLWHHSLRGNLWLSPPLMVLSFPITAVSFLLKAISPNWHHRVTAKLIRTKSASTMQPPSSQLARSDAVGALAQMLKSLGLVGRLSPLVVFVGHASNDQNNGHFVEYQLSATDLNHASALAALANDREVRQLLAEQGIEIPNSTFFIAARYERDLQQMTWANLAGVPAAFLPALTVLQANCKKRLSAQETLVPASAAIMGRQCNMALANEALLLSYEPIQDSRGQQLEKLLLTVIPKLTALNLSYYFAAANNPAFGNSNNVLHNIIGQLGIMEGVRSDLRYGLPVQMLPKQPISRLQLIVEASTTTLTEIFSRQPILQQSIQNGWLQLDTLDPITGELFHYSTAKQFTPWRATNKPFSIFSRPFIGIDTSPFKRTLEHG